MRRKTGTERHAAMLNRVLTRLVQDRERADGSSAWRARSERERVGRSAAEQETGRVDGVRGSRTRPLARRAAVVSCTAAVLVLAGGPALGQTANSFWRSSLGTADDDVAQGVGVTPEPRGLAPTPPRARSLPSLEDSASPAAPSRPATARPPLGSAPATRTTLDNRPSDGRLPSDPPIDARLPTMTVAPPLAAPLADPGGRVTAIRNAGPQGPDPNPTRIAQEADPYAAPGLQLGTIRVLPSLGLYGGYEWQEGDHAAAGESLTFGDIEPALRVESDWSRHAVTLDARGRGRIGEDTALDENYRFEARALGRLDIGPTALGSDTTLTLQLGATEEVGETLVTGLPGDRLLDGIATGVVGDVTPPAVRRDASGRSTQLGSLALDQEIGRLDLGLTGEVERSDGDDREAATTTRLRGRIGFEASQASPFVEGSVARTRLCETCTGGFDAVGVLAGLRLRDDRRLRGDVALGYETRQAEDGGATTGGLVWRGSLAYELTPLVTLDLATEATLGDVDDGAQRTLSLGLTHAPRRWLTLTGGLAVTWEDFETLVDTRTVGGTTRALSASLGAEYRLNRFASLTADASQQRYKDGVTSEVSIVNTVRVGVILRR